MSVNVWECYSKIISPGNKSRLLKSHHLFNPKDKMFCVLFLDEDDEAQVQTLNESFVQEVQLIKLLSMWSFFCYQLQALLLWLWLQVQASKLCYPWLFPDCDCTKCFRPSANDVVKCTSFMLALPLLPVF